MTTVSAARPGQARDWNLCTTYDQLGLGPDELRGVLLDIPEHWTDNELRRLAVATHAVISRVIGEMGASRQSVPGALRALAGMAAAPIAAQSASDEDELAALWEENDEPAPEREVEPSPWPEWAAPEMQAALRRSRRAGWGGTRAPWRRLAGMQLTHVRPVAGKPRGFTICDAEDYAALDGAWADANAASPTSPLLPLPLCCAFVPAARTLMLDDLDPQLCVEVPSAWQLLAQLIVWGQERSQQRMIAWIASCAELMLPPRVDRPNGGKPTGQTMDGLVRYARRWFIATHAVAPGFDEVLGGWQELIQLDLEQIADGVDEFMDRTAIPLYILRRGLVEARIGVAAYSAPGEAMRPGWFRHLRFAVVLGMLGDITCRPRELASVKPSDIREHMFCDPETGLQVAVTQVRVWVAAKGRGKKGKRRRPQPRWMTIHADTAADLRLWLRLNGISRDDPLSIWPVYHGRPKRMTGDQLSAVLKATTKGVARIPRLTGRAYTADNIRHMGSQLAQGVGHNWLASQPAMLSQVSASAFSEALLCHEPRSDVLGYMDVKRRPELWAARAALGAPGVPVTLALIHERGSAGTLARSNEQRLSSNSPPPASKSCSSASPSLTSTPTPSNRHRSNRQSPPRACQQRSGMRSMTRAKQPRRNATESWHDSAEASARRIETSKPRRSGRTLRGTRSSAYARRVVPTPSTTGN